MNARSILTVSLICGSMSLVSGTAGAQLSGGPSAAPEADTTVAPPDLPHLADVLTHLDTYEPTAGVLRRLEDILMESEAAAAVPGLLRRGEVADRTASILIHKLGVVGTHQAQRSLGEIYEDPGQVHMNRVRAVVSTGSLTRPEGETLGRLWNAVGRRSDPVDADLSNTAALGLGVLGDRLRSSDTRRATEIRSGLRDSLHAAGDPLERSIMLKAIGNLADDTLEPDVAAYLSDEFAPVRASAAQSLAMIGATGARQPLLSQLRIEPRGVVRGEIVRAMGRLGATGHALQTVNAMVLGEGHPESRFMMAAYLLENLEQYPEARPTLLHLFENDDSKRIRILTARALRP